MTEAASTTAAVRIEKDSMGELAIPESAYYGIQTLRAIQNFPISGLKPLETYVDACLLIKKATAIAKPACHGRPANAVPAATAANPITAPPPNH